MNQESETEDHHQQLQTQFFAPPGIRFHPSDFELVRFYLLEKIQAVNVHPLVTQFLVRDYDVFASQEPWQIWNYFTATSPFLDKTDLYFFTLLKPRSNTDSRFQRKVGSGTWHGEDGNNKALKFEVEIDNNRRFTAYKKRFTYKNKGSDQNGCWILYEYSLPSLSTTTVLCQLRNNNSDKEEEDESKRRKRAQSIRTKQRKRVVSSASTTTHDHAYDGTTNTDTVYNASEGSTAFSTGDHDQQTVLYKALEDDPIEPKDQKHVDGAEADHVSHDSDSFDCDALFADYCDDLGTVFEGEDVAAGYDWNTVMQAASIVVDASVNKNLDGSIVDNPSLAFEVIDPISHTNWDDSLSQSLNQQEYYQHCCVQGNVVDRIPYPFDLVGN